MLRIRNTWVIVLNVLRERMFSTNVLGQVSIDFQLLTRLNSNCIFYFEFAKKNLISAIQKIALYQQINYNLLKGPVSQKSKTPYLYAQMQYYRCNTFSLFCLFQQH